MRARFVNEMVEGARVDAVFGMRSREMRAARNGDAYLVLELTDKSGSIPAVLFRPSRTASAIPSGAAVRAQGTVTNFRGVRRLSLERMEPAGAWDPSELVGTGVRSREELERDLRALVSEVKQPRLRRLLLDIFGDKTFFEAFCTCPASQTYHHAFIGGLLQHTVDVASMCRDIVERYEQADRELLVTAALLHDIGKVDELSYSTGITYTDEGRLVGHVVASALRVRAAGEKSRVEPGLRLRLEHAILSHHGELEWGSPKRPVTFEALLLHHVDNLDAKASGFSAALRGATLVEECWTDAGNLFRRPLYAPRPVEDDRPCSSHEDEQHHRLTA